MPALRGRFPLIGNPSTQAGSLVSALLFCPRQREPSGSTKGRSLVLWKSPFASLGAMILNGRPDPYSTIGENVKSEKNFRQPLPDLQLSGVVKTPLKTNLCR